MFRRNQAVTVAVLAIAGIAVALAGCSRTPQARFTTSSLVGPAPLLVTFTNQSVNSDVFEWDFGDGSKNQEKSPSHVYEKAGLFTVTLKTTREGTDTVSSSSATVKVEPGQVASVVLNPSTVQLLPGRTAHFDARAFDAYGNEITDAAFSFSAKTGTFDSSGTFTAGSQAGSFPDLIEVAATKGQTTVRRSASLVVLPDVLSRVAISSVEPLVLAGTRQKFVAAGLDRFGNAVPLDSTTWDVDPALGTLESDGSFTIGRHPGSYASAIRVTARAGGVTAKGDADVVVRAFGPVKFLPRVMQYPYLGIVEASVTQVDDRNLQFQLRVAGPVPEKPSIDYVALIFGMDLDADNRFNEFPPDVNLRVFFDVNSNRWMGIVDAAPPEGLTQFKFTLTGNALTFSMPLDLLGNAAQVNWQASTLQYFLKPPGAPSTGDITPPQVLLLK